MALIIVVAILGLLGSGPLSTTTLTSHDSRFEITFERIARGESLARLEATIMPLPDSPGEVRLWIDERIARTMLIQHITPEPSSISIMDGGYLYTFTTQSPGLPAKVYFHFTPQNRGLITGRIGASPAKSLVVRQIVLP